MLKRCNRDATGSSAVIMACDRNYFPFALLLASQIDTSFPDRAFDICIVTNDTLPEHPLVDQHNLRLLEVQMPEGWQGFQTNKKITPAAYIRISIPQLVRDDYDRVLYLDSDILYVRGDIPALLSADLGGHSVGAVLDNLQHRNPRKLVREFKAAGLAHAKYFNSGVLLIDVARYLAQGVDKTALEYAKTGTGNMLIKHDQSALNLALHGDWAELPPVWNWPSFHKYFFFSHFVDPCMVHFMSSRKPWRDTGGIYNAAHVRTYAGLLARHFPDLAEKMPARPKMGARPWLWFAIFLRHAFDYRRLARYVRRFTSDFDIKTQ